MLTDVDALWKSLNFRTPFPGFYDGRRNKSSDTGLWILCWFSELLVLKKAGVVVKSAVINSSGPKSRSRFGLSEVRHDRDNSVARFSRVALVETVLTIRERQQRSVRRAVVASLILMGWA